MVDTAVIYSSTLGKTRKTGDYIALGLGADKFDLKKQSVINLSEYKRIIFGTYIHSGKPSKALIEFMETNKNQLTNKKLFLYICCRNEGEKGAEQCQNVSKSFDIADAVFFPGKGEKNEEGFTEDVDAYIERLSH